MNMGREPPALHGRHQIPNATVGVVNKQAMTPVDSGLLSSMVPVIDLPCQLLR